jgi:hypothetical protein
MAQRALQQCLFQAAVAVLLLFVATGLVRIRDLWTRVPEERVEFWPGVVVEDGGEESDDMAELASGEDE